MAYNIKCFDLLKKRFFTAMAFFSFNPLRVNSVKCITMNNQECRTRTKIVDINNNEPFLLSFQY